MSTTHQLQYVGAAIVDSRDRLYHTNYHKAYSESGVLIIQRSGYGYCVLVRFPQIPSEIRYKKLLSVKIRLTTQKSSSEYASLGFFPLPENFDPETVTWDTAYGITTDVSDRWGYYAMGSSWSNEFRTIDAPSSYEEGRTVFTDAVNIAKISKRALSSNSITIYPSYSGGAFQFKGVFAMLVEVDETVTITSQIQQINSPTTGWVNPAIDQTFAWEFTYAGVYPCPGNFEQASAVFHWRSGTSGSWNDVTVSGQSVTIPANTFPGGTVQWYISGTDTQGTSSQTPVYTVTTTDSEALATATEPSGTVEDGSAPIVFKWTVTNDTGSTPTGADLQYSTNGSSWTTFAQPRNTTLEYRAPANTFSAGTIYWRVRAYNRDGVAGAWSDPLSFVCIAAPDAPIVSCDAKPFTTVTWQSSGQQVYEITVDGKVYGPYFGAEKSFSLPNFLTDGQHAISVRIEGTYGLWSAPGSVTFTVTNVPGAAVTLTGLFDRDAELSWSTNDATSDFLIYRDNVQIGHASGRSFTDRIVLGYHSWRVINRLPGGYYTASNVVSGTLMTGRLAIAPLSGGAWLELTKSENSARSVVWNESQRVALRQFAGQIYPQAEAAPYKTMSAGFDVAWTHAEAEQAVVFASLIGQPVIFKTPCEGAMVGILTAWQRNSMHFYRSYSATVQRIHWRDFVDADD